MCGRETIAAKMTNSSDNFVAYPGEATACVYKYTTPLEGQDYIYRYYSVQNTTKSIRATDKSNLSPVGFVVTHRHANRHGIINSHATRVTTTTTATVVVWVTCGNFLSQRLRAFCASGYRICGFLYRDTHRHENVVPVF